MLFKDKVDFVFQHIKKNKLRVFMTVLAATMGCAFLIVLASVGFGLHKSVEQDILSNENVTNISLFEGENLTAEDIEDIETIEHVRNVLDRTDVHAITSSNFKDRSAQGELVLTDIEKYKEINKNLFEGSYPKAPNEVLVGYHFGQLLLNDADRKAMEEKSEKAAAEGTWYDGSEEGYKQSLIGKEIEITLTPHISNATASEKMTVKIVGVLEKPAYEFEVDNKIIMSNQQISTIETLYNEAIQVSNIENLTEMPPFSSTEYTIYADRLENVKGILQTLRADGYNVYSVTEQLDDINIVFSIMKIGLIFVGTIAVLIASIGIFNTMTMAVTERTREIGVMKAIGASPKLVQRLFLMESTFIGVFGTVLAIVISYIISLSANALLPIILKLIFGENEFTMPESMVFSYIPLELVVVAAAISIGVAVISGLRPARKATKIEVMQALRQEL